MGIVNTLLECSFEQFWIFSIGLFLLLSISRIIHLTIFHPLAHIPGPLLPKITSLWLYYHSYVGDEATEIFKLHEKYGPLVRVAPNETDISNGTAIAPIYVTKGGFAKAPCYSNFDFDGHITIFSAQDVEYRSPRAKAIVSLFSTKSIREGLDTIYECADTMVARLKEESLSGRPVNILNLTRSFAVDTVSAYLFDQNYNGTSEKGSSLSASAYVDSAVAIGRLFYLPNWLFAWVEWIIERCFPDEHAAVSMTLVDKFVDDLLALTTSDAQNFPGRLLAIGLEEAEIKVQCKDLIFAGTDSTGMNLATLFRQLALNPDKHETLRKEILANSESTIKQDIQSLPYFSAVVKEALRISMANPTRLPRLVPSSGWTLDSVQIPPGTIVGCSTFQMHFDEAVFPNARTFQPERWLEDNVTPEMNRNWFAFGAGPRGCIARNLATVELFTATERVVESNILRGAKACQDEVEILEWFNSKVKGEKIELAWG